MLFALKGLHAIDYSFKLLKSLSFGIRGTNLGSVVDIDD